MVLIISLSCSWKEDGRWRDMRRVKEGLFFFNRSLNADGKGQVERKRLSIYKRKSMWNNLWFL